jgi:hypothetical protein
MAPLIDGAYAHIEGLLGAEFTEMFHQILDDVIVKLKPQRTRPKPQRATESPLPWSPNAYLSFRCKTYPVSRLGCSG